MMALRSHPLRSPAFIVEERALVLPWMACRPPLFLVALEAYLSKLQKLLLLLSSGKKSIDQTRVARDASGAALGRPWLSVAARMQLSPFLQRSIVLSSRREAESPESPARLEWCRWVVEKNSNPKAGRLFQQGMC